MFVCFIRIGLIVMAIVIGEVSRRRCKRLKRKFEVLGLYYDQVELMPEPNPYYPDLIGNLRLALNRKDWDEAYLIEDSYYGLQSPSPRARGWRWE